MKHLQEFDYENLGKLLKSIEVCRILHSDAVFSGRLNSKYYEERLKLEREFMGLFWKFVSRENNKVPHDLLVEVLTILLNANKFSAKKAGDSVRGTPS